MAATTMDREAPALRRVLGTWDLILFNIVAIVALRWLSVAAQVGPSSLLLWLLGLVGFFVPLALAVLYLSARIPGEGGLYLWTKAAFGDLHGFIAGWTYWVSNLAYFPTALLFSAGIFLHVGGDRWLQHANDSNYNLFYCLIVLWTATGLGILGLERAKWLQNIGGIATWTAAALILGGGVLALFRFGSATTFTVARLTPDFGQLSTFSSLATIALAFQGLELGPIMGGEIRDPARQIPRATIISCFIIAAIYIAGTTSLLVALPSSTIGTIGGITA
jgi:amino acid transporter